jgi:hypothetical protein
MQPSFEIDSTGKVICKSHTYYDVLKEVPLEHDMLGNIARERTLNCSKCHHYRDDDCYFPKAEIDKIKKDMNFFRKGIRCEICGGRINQIFNVLYKFQSKELLNLNVNLGLLCCDCYRTYKDPSYNSLISIAKIAISIFFLTSVLMLMVGTLPFMFQTAIMLGLTFLPIMSIMAVVLIYVIIINIRQIIKRSKFKRRMRS